jgi:hypothetical protein
MGTTERVVIVGGPRCGKSWHARSLGLPVFCGDPISKVKDPEAGVMYLPEHVPIADTRPGANDGAAQWIAERWFGDMEGPWVCEGWVMARALRRWMRMAINDGQAQIDSYPCDRIIVFEHQREDQEPSSRQIAMHRGVMTTWDEICDYYDAITEYRT